MSAYSWNTLLLLLNITVCNSFADSPSSTTIPSLDISQEQQTQLSEEDRGALVKLNTEIVALHSRYFEKDSRTFFSEVNYILAQQEKISGTQLVSPIWDFRSRWGLPSYAQSEHESLIDDRRYKGDFQRIKRFNRSFSRERARKDPSKSKNKETIQDYEVFLVPGWGNEGFRKNYFSDSKSSLEHDFDLPPEQIHIFYVNSLKSIEINSKALYEQIQNTLNTTSRKVLLVGHSMGGSTVLYTLLDHPELLTHPRIVRAVTIQSPLKGTPTAEFSNKLENALAAIGSFFSFWDSESPEEQAECKVQTTGVDTGAASMVSVRTYEKIKAFTATITDEQLIALNKKLFYISSFTSKEPTKLGTYLISNMNDGTVPAESQRIRWFGRDLALLSDVGHTDLVLSGSKSAMTEAERKGFTRALFDTLLDPEVDEEVFK